MNGRKIYRYILYYYYIMEQHLELYKNKSIILTTYINKFNVVHEKQLISDDIENSKTHCKQFLTKTIKYISNFSKQSSKVFTSSDYYIYTSLAELWTHLSDDETLLIWNLLYELFTISVKVFPVLKTTDYNFINILLTLDTQKTDIPLPDLPALHILSGCMKETMKRIKTELKEKKISENLVERIGAEFQPEDIASLQQVNKMKTKFKEIMARDEIQYILNIIKSYFNETIIEKLKTDVTQVFESDKFKSFQNKYKKNKIMAMIQNSEMTFSYIKHMIDESGIIVLLGSDFDCPTSFEECKTIIEKYSGQTFSATDLKSLFNDNSKQILEIPQVKKFLKNSEYKDILGPIISMFEKTDHEAETKKRKEKRMKKKLKKLKKENKD